MPPSIRSGKGIKVAVLDTGMDFKHPILLDDPSPAPPLSDNPFKICMAMARIALEQQQGQKLAGTTPRYGIGYKTSIFTGKVLSNTGSGTQAGVLAGMNWAIANRCPVTSMSLGSQSPVHPAYTAAGQAALNNGCLIIAAAGNASSNTGSPANSPTIMSVASLDKHLAPSFSLILGKLKLQRREEMCFLLGQDPNAITRSVEPVWPLRM